jgi:hypothetical protein
MNGTVLKVELRRPARKQGVRLGSWTNQFYKPRVLVRFTHLGGQETSAWINADRLC